MHALMLFCVSLRSINTRVYIMDGEEGGGGGGGRRQRKQCEGDNLACVDLPGVDHSVLLHTGMPFLCFSPDQADWSVYRVKTCGSEAQITPITSIF